MWRFKYDGKTYSGYCDKLAKAKKQLNDKRYEAPGIHERQPVLSYMPHGHLDRYADRGNIRSVVE